MVGTQGSLTNYQSLYDNGVFFGKNKLVICYEIIDKDTGKVGGYGMLVNVKTDKLCSKYDMSNFTLKHDINGRLVVKSLGAKFKSVKMKSLEVNTGYNSKLGETNKDVCSEVKDSYRSNMLPTINVYSYNDIKNNEFASSAQDKLFKAFINMKRLSPYYHTILMSIKKEASTALDTMGVTEERLLYNPKFVDSLTIAEITFVLIHEVCHIAMRHSYRHGNRDNVMWNIACDLYVNSIISKDFDCYFGQGEKEIDTPQGKAVIKTVDSGVFLSTIGETLDFGVDTPETIYARLVKENPPQGSAGSSSGNSGNGSGDSSKSGDSDSDSSSDGSGNPKSSSSLSGKEVSKSKSSLDADSKDVNQSDDYKSGKSVSVVYNGKKLEGKINLDITTEEIGNSKERNERMNNKSLDSIQGMKTAVDVAEEKSGESLMKNAGTGAGLIRRSITFGLSTLVNWRVMLKNMCKSKPKKTYTMGSPNEVYMNSGVTVASRRTIGKPTAIDGVKVCIDVSGSVTEDELAYYLSECNNIMRYYDVEGELIYWSTMIGDAGKFSDLKDMLKVDPKSTGGTDVKCVFDYLAGKTRVNSKYEETRIRDISCILIFTDGYAEYAKYFGKKVIWVIPDSKFTFNPPFGKIACMN